MEVTGGSPADWATPKIQQGPVLDARCRRACFARWSLRMKRLWQTGQANFFSPVWVRRWRDNSSERANLLSQPSHLHLKGFSPLKDRQVGGYYFNILVIFIQRSQTLLYFTHWCQLLVTLFLLTCMRPHVGLEVRALEIGFVAVVAGTNMAA